LPRCHDDHVDIFGESLDEPERLRQTRPTFEDRAHAEFAAALGDAPKHFGNPEVFLDVRHRNPDGCFDALSGGSDRFGHLAK